jgi:2,5-diamino-6-(ribosylamino)-4(3H)-pyrimidinone 5'-phosphate reductase
MSTHPSTIPRRPALPLRRDNPPASDRPFVRLNLAVTADGKIATSNRAISSFGGPRDLRHLFQLRHRTDAILCGATTINAENADLGPGPSYSSTRRSTKSGFPLRVIASGRGRVNPISRLFHRPFGPIIILTTTRIPATRLRRLESLAIAVKVCGDERIDLPAALAWLRSEWNVRDVLCEGGSELNAALLDDDLVDEINLTICPWIVGGRAAPTLADGRGVPNLDDALTWKLDRARRLEKEIFLTYRRIRNRSNPKSRRR